MRDAAPLHKQEKGVKVTEEEIAYVVKNEEVDV